MKHIIIDIETEPLPAKELFKLMPDIKPDARLKDPAKIKDDIEAKRQKFVDNAALSPQTARICAIGVAGEDGLSTYVGLREEKDYIDIFREAMIKGKIVTYMGAKFDIPFLLRRAIKYDINLFHHFYDDGRRVSPPHNLFVDLAEVWGCGNNEYWSLGDVAEFLGVGEKPKTTELFHHIHARDPKEGVKYLIRDLNLTVGISNRLGYPV